VHYRRNIHDIILHCVDDPVRESVNQAATKTSLQPPPESRAAGYRVKSGLDARQELLPQPFPAVFNPAASRNSAAAAGSRTILNGSVLS
jgi:hypothetical protein